tara:strand:+ start:255 stop:668 length:414 start_codon:yes stop_codon:yes gene_type:complete
MGGSVTDTSIGNVVKGVIVLGILYGLIVFFTGTPRPVGSRFGRGVKTALETAENKNIRGGEFYTGLIIIFLLMVGTWTGPIDSVNKFLNFLVPDGRWGVGYLLLVGLLGFVIFRYLLVERVSFESDTKKEKAMFKSL